MAVSYVKSSFSQTDCVEVAALPDGSVRVRDSKDTSKLPHEFTAREWAAFIAGVKAGEFDFGLETPARQA